MLRDLISHYIHFAGRVILYGSDVAEAGNNVDTYFPDRVS